MSSMKGALRSWCTAILALALVSWPGRAPADEVNDEHFSSRGRLLLGGHVSGGWVSDAQLDNRTGARWWIDVDPYALYFVRDRIGVGGWMGAGTARVERGATSRNLDLGVEALFDVKLGPQVSLFIMPGVGFGQRWRTDRPLINEGGLVFYDERTEKLRFVRTQARLPLTFHCSPSIAIGFGPILVFDVIVRHESGLDAITRATSDLHTPRTQVAVGLTSFIGGSF